METGCRVLSGRRRVAGNSKEPARWIRLIRDAQDCRICPRMACSRRVLTERNGPHDARIMFVAEAPGRLGAERTGIPLFGDRTGDRFEELLSVMGWKRCDVFLTNAVLCNPKDEAGNNDAPSGEEVRNCSSLLTRTIEIVNPVVVIALGNVALRALDLLERHTLSLSKVGTSVLPWHGRRLAALYHPGPRAAVHRPWRLQLTDARSLARKCVRILSAHPGESRHHFS